MDAKKEEIIAKIMKLMELGNAENNSNPHEREAASRKAAKLMAEYSLDFADLRAGKPADSAFVTINVDGSEYSKVDFEAVLALAIAEAFDCKVINTYKNGPWQIAFCGTKHDLEIAVYFFKFLRRTMYAMATKNVTAETVRPTYTRTGSIRVDVRMARRNYCFGLVETIHTRMRDLYLKREEFIPSDCKALMVVKNAGLQTYFKQQFPNAVNGRKIHLSGDTGAYRKGQADGRNVNLSRPIAHTGGSSAQIG
jgi:hypothetical protein